MQSHLATSVFLKYVYISDLICVPYFLDNSLKLKNGIFHEVKPGLSSYADNPKVGAESLIPLLDQAKQFIPQDAWSSTPISLKATAGLRLLPKEKADAILAAVS